MGVCHHSKHFLIILNILDLFNKSCLQVVEVGVFYWVLWCHRPCTCRLWKHQPLKYYKFVKKFVSKTTIISTENLTTSLKKCRLWKHFPVTSWQYLLKMLENMWMDLLTVFSHSMANYLSLVLQEEAGKQYKSAQATLSKYVWKKNYQSKLSYTWYRP